jgi:hypothetical protein
MSEGILRIDPTTLSLATIRKLMSSWDPNYQSILGFPFPNQPKKNAVEKIIVDTSREIN